MKRTLSRVVVAVDWLDAKGDTAWASELGCGGHSGLRMDVR